MFSQVLSFEGANAKACPLEVNHLAQAVVFDSISIRPNAVDTNGIALIFNGTCLQEGLPRMDSCRRPIGHIDHDIVWICRRISAEYREAQIITNLEVQRPPRQAIDVEVFPAVYTLSSPANPNRWRLSYHSKSWVGETKKQRFHESVIGFYSAGNAAHNRGIFFLAPAPHSFERLRPTVGLIDPGIVPNHRDMLRAHAESRGPHFGQNNQVNLPFLQGLCGAGYV